MSADFGIRIHSDKSASKLVALADPDQPGVIFRSAMTGSQQFLQHDCDFDAIWRRQCIELNGCLPRGNSFLWNRVRDRAVGLAIAPIGAVALLPDPDFWRRVLR